MIQRPSKKIVLIGLACVVAVGGIFFSAHYSKSGSTTSPYGESLTAITPEQMEKDADNDGLKDWEEELWGSNVRVADSDNDGTSDGEEVKASRNPIVAGPNDAINTTAKADVTVSANENLTATDKFSREFIARYLIAKENGDLNEASQAKIVNDVLGSDTLQLQSKLYGISNLKITTEDTPESERAYGENLRAILKKNSPPNLENELSIINRAMQNNDEKELQALDPIIKGFEGLLRDYLTLSVPPSAASIHVNLLNATSMVLESDRALKDIFVDPIKGYAAMSEYTQAVKLLQQAVAEMGQYFTKRGITFTAGQ